MCPFNPPWKTPCTAGLNYINRHGFYHISKIPRQITPYLTFPHAAHAPTFNLNSSGIPNHVGAPLVRFVSPINLTVGQVNQVSFAVENRAAPCIYVFSSYLH
jgi:hypothetical protein